MNRIIIVRYEENPAAIELFKNQVYRLWGQHSAYTRQAIISILGSLEDKEAVIARLMKNQEDIGNAIAPYYGDAAAAEITRLLKQHITIAIDIFQAIKESNSTAELEAAWKTNAEAIAKFLSTADPTNWPYDVVLSILEEHCEYTLKEATSRFAKNWTEDMMAYEEDVIVIMQLAKAMANGIIESFPEAFVIQTMLRSVNR